MPKIIIHTDGGSRGNPGPAALGVVIESASPKWKKEYGHYLGETTNNVAEYSAVVFALKKAKEILKSKASVTDVEVKADSELIVRQMAGIYRVKNPGLKPLFAEIQTLKSHFKSVTFTHVRREKNTEADAMVNIALDNKTKKTSI